MTPTDDVAAARRVLATEASALTALGAAIDGPLRAAFRRALDLIDQATRSDAGPGNGPVGRPQGRVVVSGMGKSGHIGRKIAATLASTGTPALFVHPGEASHGDLGMITGGDVVLALSNSGETPELAAVIAHARRFAIPLVAIAGRSEGALQAAADATLVLPPEPEACPMGLAPTTSTTMMLALGDAIAVALIERRGFGAEDFHVFHPGGKLGRRLAKVADLMHAVPGVPLVPLGTRMSDAILVMSQKSFGCVGVTRDGALVGIVTDGDLRRHMGDGLLAQTVDAVMTAAPKSIRPSALAAEALHIMNSRAITSLFVVEDGRPVGILHIHDCLRAGIA